MIDAWDHPVYGTSDPLPLVAGRKYDLKLEYREQTVTSQIRLRWASASTAP